MNVNAKVVDISHYDDVEVIGTEYVGFKKLRAARYLGVINKATQGRAMVDRTYEARRAAALQAGLLYGAYHFFTAEDAVAQANHFLAEVRPDRGTLLALDHETPAVPLSHAKIFLLEVKRQIGRYPLLYCFSAMLRQQFAGVTDPFWNDVPLWLAHYTTAPWWPTNIWPKPTLWQFTGDGNGPGPHQVPGVSIAGGIDNNSFDGSDDQLVAFWTGAPVNTPAEPVTSTAAPVNQPSKRQTGIIATCFGGEGDVNASAYGGMVDPNGLGVALPARVPAPLPKVTVYRGDKSVTCHIVDVGPHNTHDPYWINGTRPQAEDEGEGHSGNKAGIDLTPAVFAALGIGPHDPEYGKTTVDWEFAT